MRTAISMHDQIILMNKDTHFVCEEPTEAGVKKKRNIHKRSAETNGTTQMKVLYLYKRGDEISSGDATRKLNASVHSVSSAIKKLADKELLELVRQEKIRSTKVNVYKITQKGIDELNNQKF